jgi:hypothetical protein
MDNEKQNTEPVSEFALLVEKQAKSNEEAKALIKKQEELIALQRMGGQTLQPQPVQPKPESDAEYRKRIEKEVREGKYDRPKEPIDD